jgi:hypothetical protein
MYLKVLLTIGKKDGDYPPEYLPDGSSAQFRARAPSLLARSDEPDRFGDEP